MEKLQIIGTSHVAKESVKKIRETIEKWKPDIICLELDSQRAVNLFKQKSEIKFSDIFKLGLFGWLFAQIGSYLQKQFGTKTGVLPGEEMREAIRYAKKYNIEIYLIDQPIGTTLKKLNKISFFEKMRLLFYFLGIRRSKIEFNLQKIPDNAVVSELLKELKKFRGLYRVLVEERNKIMAKKIRALRKTFPKKKILVIVGAGHVEGLAQLLK